MAPKRGPLGNLGEGIPSLLTACLPHCRSAVGLRQPLNSVPAGLCLPPHNPREPSCEAHGFILSPAAPCWHQCWDQGLSTAVGGPAPTRYILFQVSRPKCQPDHPASALGCFFFPGFYFTEIELLIERKLSAALTAPDTRQTLTVFVLNY